MPHGYEVASKLLTGVLQFADEQPAMQSVALPCTADCPEPDGIDAFDGAILWTDRGHRWVSHLAGRGMPAVNCNRDWLGQPGVVSVGLDNAAFARTVVDHLTAAGRVRQVAVVGVNLRERPHTAEKCYGILGLAASRGLATGLHEIAGPHPDEARDRIIDVAGERALLAFLRDLPRPAGVWCENDYVARMVCNAAAYLGLAIPEQLAVVGAGNHRIAVAGAPTITTVSWSIEAIGRAAAATLFDWLTNAGGRAKALAMQPPNVVLPLETLIARGSTGAVNRFTQAVDEARRIIEAEACDGLTVEGLCERLDVSKGTLTARFSAVMGVSPGAQIRRTKVEAAKRLLRESRLSVGEIGAAIGLSDHSKFSKFFRREVGLTPGQFRGARPADPHA